MSEPIEFDGNGWELLYLYWCSKGRVEIWTHEAFMSDTMILPKHCVDEAMREWQMMRENYA